ncbi:MAG: hypothetical protein ABIP16_00345, partial [Thermomonas sp.]
GADGAADAETPGGMVVGTAGGAAVFSHPEAISRIAVPRTMTVAGRIQRTHARVAANDAFLSMSTFIF